MLETFYDLDELVDAIAARPQRLDACRSSRCSPSTRAPRRSPASPRARPPTGSPRSTLAAIGANHGAGPARRARRRSRRCSGDGRALAALPNIGLASLVGRPGHLPARDAGLLRRVRRARARPRRAPDRRLLRHDADGDRRDPRCDRRGAAGALAARGARARARRLARRGAARDRVRAARCARASSSSRCSSTLRSAARAAACSRSRARSRSRVASGSSTSTTTRPHAPA